MSRSLYDSGYRVGRAKVNDAEKLRCYELSKELIASARSNVEPGRGDALLSIAEVIRTHLPGLMDPLTNTIHCHGGHKISLTSSSYTGPIRFTAPPCKCPGGITISQMCMEANHLTNESDCFRIKRNTCPCTRDCPVFPPDLAHVNAENVQMLLWLALNSLLHQGDRMQFVDLLARCMYEDDLWKQGMLRCSFVHHCCHEATEAKAKEYSESLQLGYGIGATLFRNQRLANQASVNILLPCLPLLLTPRYGPTLKSLIKGTATASEELLKFVRDSCL